MHFDQCDITRMTTFIDFIKSYKHTKIIELGESATGYTKEVKEMAETLGSINLPKSKYTFPLKVPTTLQCNVFAWL